MGAAADMLQSELSHAGYDTIQAFDLTKTKLAFCQGEFDCWVKTPGLCRAHDAETEIVTAAHDADALVLFDRVAFGGHDHLLKRALDRFLCLLEPFFVKRMGLTHHALRYEHHQRLYAVGWARDASVEVSRTHAELAEANAINFLSPRWGSVVLTAARTGEWRASLRSMLETVRVAGASITDRDPLRGELLEVSAPHGDDEGPATIRRAAILVGSAKIKGTSASEAIAHALDRRLSAAGIATELHFATEFVHDDARTVKSAASIAECDLFVLATPLYVDSLPSLATHALQLVANARSLSRRRARFVAIVNCGFPEPEQNRTALRIARHFADEAGYAWGGGLPIGGGGVIPPASKLDEPHGQVAHVVRALDLATPTLTTSGMLNREAIVAVTEVPLPDVLYRTMGDLGWRWQARQNGLTQRDLHARPLDAGSPGHTERRVL